MPYIASALVRKLSGSWSGRDVDLSEVENVDELVDELRQDADDEDTAVLFVEEDDEYLLIAASADEEVALFLSDQRALETGLAGRIAGSELGVEAVSEDSDEESTRPGIEPAGDPSLLASLGLDAETLLELCAKGGQLPSDIVFAICEELGCTDVLEAVRGV